MTTIPPPPSVNTSHASPDLNEFCSICYENFGAKIDNKPRVLAKTKCNHFFHQFCLQQHLDHGANTLCPLCRRSAVEYSMINLDRQQNEQTQTTIDIADEMLNAGGSALRALGSLAFDASKLGAALLYTGATTGARAIASAFEVTRQQIEEKSQKLFNEFIKVKSKFEVDMNIVKQEYSLLLTTIRSLPESHRNKAYESLKRLELAFETFEDNLKDNKRSFKEVLESEKRLFNIR